MDQTSPSAPWQLEDAIDVPMIELYPALAGVSSLPVDFARPMSVRLQNVLARWRGLEWGAYLNVTPGDLGERRNAGRKCLVEFLALAAESTMGAAGQSLQRQDGSMADDENSARRARLESVAKAAETLAAWGQERGLATVGPLLSQLTPERDLPPDVDRAWAVVASASLADLTPTVVGRATIDEVFDGLLACLDERQRHVFEARSIPERGPTLQELADRLNVTRERVRQIQEKAETRVTARLAKEEFASLRWRSHSLRTVIGDSMPVTSETYRSALEGALAGCSADRRPLLAQYLLRLAGYSERSGWMIHQDAAVISGEVLRAEADDRGLIEDSRVAELLSAVGVGPANHEAMLERIGGFRRFGDQIAIWSGSVVDKVVRVLAVRGTPTSPDELAAIIGEGHSVRAMRNRLSDDPRLARVGKNQWALRTWGLNEYSGAADEIAEEIERQGGAVSLAFLAEELASRFGIAESSVRAYAQTPRFVIEGGLVRLRRPGESVMVSTSIATAKGCFQDSPSSVTFSITVDREVLRGSGRAAPLAVAVFLGLVPGTERLFRATHAGQSTGTVSMTWPVDSVAGPTLGSTRAIAVAAQAVDGDLLRLRFDGAEHSLHVIRIRPDQLASLEPLARLSALTGLGGLDTSNAVDRLAASLSVDPDQLRSQLARRGDKEVIGLLPVAAIDPDLYAALAELEEALAPLD